jgi:hypothetical protein
MDTVWRGTVHAMRAGTMVETGEERLGGHKKLLSSCANYGNDLLYLVLSLMILCVFAT